MKAKRDNAEEARARHFTNVAAWFTFAQQRKECHVRFDASVGVHSQSLGHRHVGNPATASVAQTLAAICKPQSIIVGGGIQNAKFKLKMKEQPPLNTRRRKTHKGK